MKKIIYIILFIIATTFIQCNNNSNTTSNKPVFTNLNDSVTLPIAYVNIDSLLLNYDMAKDLNEKLMGIQDNYRTTLSQKEKQLRNTSSEFERKTKNNAFLNSDKQKEEQQRITKLQKEYQDLMQYFNDDFEKQQKKLNIQLEDNIKQQIYEYNKEKGYHMIFSNEGTSNIFYSDQKYNITKEILEFLNKNYKSSK